MPSSGASWRTRERIRAAPLDKEEPTYSPECVEGNFSEVGREVFRIRGTRPLDLPITTLDAIVAHGDWGPYPFFLRPAK